MTGLSKARDLVAATRPHFLLGGVLMNLVGIALAVHLGYPIGWPEALIFQVSLTSFQVAGALVNEYADAEADRTNLNRTMLTGGSGALSPGRLDRSVALTVALPFAALGISAAAALPIVYGAPVEVPILGVLGFLAAMAYSSPAIRLSRTVVGDPMMAVSIGFLAPASAFLVHSGGWDIHVLGLTSVIVLQLLALMILFEYPDMESDLAAGRRNIVCTVGRASAWWLVIGFLTLGATVALATYHTGMPIEVAGVMSLTLLEETAFLLAFRRRLRSRNGYAQMTMLGAAFFVLLLVTATVTLWDY